jgi:hypothetical protein
MLLLVSYIGGMEDQRSTFLYSQYGVKMTAQLDALGIEYAVIKNIDNIRADVADAVRMMHALKAPVALLFTGTFTH